MFKKVINRVSKKGICRNNSIFCKGLLQLCFLTFIIFTLESCDTCTGTNNGGSGTDEVIYFSALPANGVNPNIYSTSPIGGSVKSHINNAITFSTPSISGKIAYIRKNINDGLNNLLISSLDGTDTKLLASDNEIFSVSIPILSPNGKYIVFNAGDSKLFYIDNSSSTVFNQISGKMTAGCEPTFSYNSKYLAFFETESSNNSITLNVVDATSTDVINKILSKNLGTVKLSGQNDYSINWSYDSKTIVYSVTLGNFDQITIYNLETGIERTISVPNTEIGGRNASISPKQDFLAVSGTDGNIWLIFIATNDLRFSKITNSEGFEQNRNPKWSKNGEKLIFSSASQFDSGIYSSLICTELKYDIAIARVIRSYILSNNAYKGFWNLTDVIN